jgi:hypothetical protein
MLSAGDWHSTFVTSISSNGDGIIYGPYYGPMIPANPHIKFSGAVKV